jgi:large subunit ribosomal protein L35
MGYKFKPNKGVKKRIRVSKTGKLKFSHEMNSHLRSGRTAQKKRHLGRPAILAEANAGRMRKLLGIVGSRPAQTAHKRALAAKALAEHNASTTDAPAETAAK